MWVLDVLVAAAMGSCDRVCCRPIAIGEMVVHVVRVLEMLVAMATWCCGQVRHHRIRVGETVTSVVRGPSEPCKKKCQILIWCVFYKFHLNFVCFLQNFVCLFKNMFRFKILFENIGK